MTSGYTWRLTYLAPYFEIVGGPSEGLWSYTERIERSTARSSAPALTWTYSVDQGGARDSARVSVEDSAREPAQLYTVDHDV